MPTYSERFKLASFQRLKLMGKHDVSYVNTETVLKISITDAIANQLVNTLQLIERQHMLIANQKEQINTNLSELNSAKNEIISLQGELIRTSKVERFDIDDEIFDRLLTAFQLRQGLERFIVTLQSPRCHRVQ